MDKINHEQEVKRVYPDAELKWYRRAEIYLVIADYEELGRSLYADFAWEKAYEQLKKEGKL
jgi:hypothetical protein